MKRKILVVGETREGKIRSVSFEAISAGKTIAQGGEVIGVLAGSSISPLAVELIHFGADRVIIIEDKKLEQYTSDGYAQALTAVMEQEQPDGIVLGHTALGKDLSPRMAVKWDAGLVSDAISVKEENGEIVFTRPIYSGKAFEKVIVESKVILATIRPNNITPLEKNEQRSGAVTSIVVPIADLRTVIQEVVRKAAGGVDLAEAKVVVAGGRGVKSKEGFEPLQKLANILGGAVGASRGACDADYCDYSLQIGQTGKVITPDLYIACGISGAIQHLAGMSNSKVIVAINKDPEADIFKIADYGIVGDLFEVVPLLTEEFKKIKEKSV